MRIGIIALGSRGDVQPYVALGKGLKQADYEVVLLTHDPYEGLVLGEGLEFFTIGGNPRKGPRTEFSSAEALPLLDSHQVFGTVKQHLGTPS